MATTPPPAENPAPESPPAPEMPRDESSTATLWWCVAGLGVYLMPFALVFFDEVVFKTYWLSKNLPSEVGEWLRRMYPFYVLLRR